MIRRPPISTLTDTLLPYPTLSRPAVISFRPSSPLKMTMRAKHSSIATIKSRKNRGALLLLLAAATMLVMGAPVSAQETPDFEAIRSVDTDIAAIGYRLATANVPLCDRQGSGLGLLLHTPDQ